MFSEYLLLCALSISGMSSESGIDEKNAREEFDRSGSVFISQDSSSFDNAITVLSGTDYYAFFSNFNDDDYYCFVPNSYGVYALVATCSSGAEVTVSVFGKTSSNTYVALASSYVVSSNESGYGDNHGLFLDTDNYTSFYYQLHAEDASWLTTYTFIIEGLTPSAPPTGYLELYKYNVASKYYSRVCFYGNNNGSPVTSGYNPSNGPAGIYYPSGYVAGDQLPLPNGSSIDTTSDYPYTAIGRLKTASAFLVGPNIALTAGHCVTHHGRVCEDISINGRIYFGNNGDSDYNSNYKALAYITDVYFPTIHLNESYNNSGEYDWACCVLDDNYGYDCGYLPLFSDTYATYTTSTVIVIDGYRGEEYYQTVSYANYIESNGHLLRYTEVTLSGDSGAPVVNMTLHAVVGIHTSIISGNYSQGISFNQYVFQLFSLLGGGGSL